MLHTHHITPRYMGGTDEKSNLVKVTVTQHAMFHYCNWKLWGNKEDWLAWKGLTGEIGKESIVAELRLRGSKKGIEVMLERNRFLRETSPEYKEREKVHCLRIQKMAVEAAKTESSRNKRFETFQRIGHQQKESNSQYGTMWVTNGERNRKIKKTEPLPEGYYPGRKLK